MFAFILKIVLVLTEDKVIISLSMIGLIIAIIAACLCENDREKIMKKYKIKFFYYTDLRWDEIIRFDKSVRTYVKHN